MAAPILYRWDDANAPVARGERTSMIEILTACLVTGYGSRPPAGWTRQFVNAEGTKAIFRNDPSGTGMVLRIDAATPSQSNLFYASGYEAASSVDDVVFPFYTGTLPVQYISNQNSTQSRPWVLLADERAFYFFCWYNLTVAPTKDRPATIAYYFGDIVCDSQDDAYGCGCILSGTGNGMQFNLRNATQATDIYGIWMARVMSGAPGGVGCSIVAGGGPGSTQIPGNAGPQFVAARPMITRPHINNAAVYTFRGFLPGFWYPCHDKPFDQLAEVVIGGHRYLSVIAGFFGQAGNVLLSLEDWRA